MTIFFQHTVPDTTALTDMDDNDIDVTDMYIFLFSVLKSLSLDRIRWLVT
jgi:hypothetical protein